MPRFQVTPEQLVAAGTRLRAAGTRLQEAAGGFSQTAGDLPAACGAEDAAAACEEMGTAWTQAMLQVATATTQLGVRLEAAAENYATTDETAMPAFAALASEGAARTGEGVRG